MTKITSEQASFNVISTCFSDTQSIKVLEESIKRLSSREKVTSKEDDEFEDNPQYKKMMEAMRKDEEKKLENLKTKGSHPDALQPIVLLMGNITKIRETVLKSVKETIANKELYGYDVEFREINSSELTKEFVSSLPRPTGNDGGILVVSNFSAFVESYSPGDQIGLLKNIMIKQAFTSYGIGPVCTWWRIIFIENTDDENKCWPDSCLLHFGNKGCLYSYFVE